MQDDAIVSFPPGRPGNGDVNRIGSASSAGL
jgi:hypothetical protein